jgi:hypothetical protein
MPADITDFEQRKIAVEERKIALEESFPRKWGGVITGAFVTAVVSVLTFGFNAYTYMEQADDRRDENFRKNAETTRSVLDLYFKSTQNNSSIEEKINNLALFAAIANNDEVRVIFGVMRENAVGQLRKDPKLSITDINATLPSLYPTNTRENGVVYTVYIQYLQSDEEARKNAMALREKLLAFGLRVPAIDGEVNAPDKTEIRYYNDAQRQVVGPNIMSGIAALGNGSEIVEKVLRNASLPADTLEIWLGRKS